MLRKKHEKKGANDGGESPRLDEKTSDRTFPGQASAPKTRGRRAPAGATSVKDAATDESRAPGSHGYEELGGGYGSYRPDRGAKDFDRWPAKDRPVPKT